jgi:methionyl-tRNA synthetase
MSRCYLSAGRSGDADPGWAARLVRADVVARQHRMRGDRMRFLTAELDDVGLAATVALRDAVALCSTDRISAVDPRHVAGVVRLWRACALSGGLYRALDRTWFFRLSSQAERVRALITSGELRIEPAARRAEVLAMLAAAPADVPVSRRGADGVAVPDEPGQVIAGWWDAAATSITGLGYGAGGADHRKWWLEGDRRVRVVGTAGLFEEAVVWPAVLLSAGLPPPTDVLVVPDPAAGDEAEIVALARQFGGDAVRWALLRDAPGGGNGGGGRLDVRRVARAHRELSGELGALVDRVTAMVHRYRKSIPPEPHDVSGPPGIDPAELLAVCRSAPDQVSAALDAFDVVAAGEAVWRIVTEAHRYLRRARPWDLAGAERDGDRDARRHLDVALAAALSACRVLAGQLTPFLPATATRIAEQCAGLSGALAPARPLFPKPAA